VISIIGSTALAFIVDCVVARSELGSTWGIPVRELVCISTSNSLPIEVREMSGLIVGGVLGDIPTLMLGTLALHKSQE